MLEEKKRPILVVSLPGCSVEGSKQHGGLVNLKGCAECVGPLSSWAVSEFR